MAENKVFRKLGTEPVHQISRASLTIHVLCIHDSCTENIFNVFLVCKECLLTYVIASSYFQLMVLGGTKKSAVGILRFHATPTVLEVLFYFYAMRLLDLTRKEGPLRVTI